MANGAFKFKDNSGNVVSFISGSGSDILISGGTLNLSGMTGLTLGNLTMSGTTQNAVSTSHAASYLLTSSFNSYTGTTNTIIGSLQTSTGSLNTFTSSTDGRLTSIETSTGSLNSYTTSTNTRLGVIESTTSSLNTFTSSASGRLNSIEGVTGSYATTGSNTFNGNLTVTGYIDAQELRTTYISSSILYRSGSTKFGDELTDTHTFTGSVLISGSLSVPNSNLISGSVQVDVMSTTNIARLATTGSNTFTSNQIVSGSITSTSTITGTNFVTNGTTLYGVTLKGRAADNYGAIGFYSSDGVTRYGYVQSHSTNGGQLNITSDGGGQLILDNRGIVATSAISGSSAIFTSTITTNAGIIGNNSNNLYLSSNSAGGEISFWGNQLNTRLVTILGTGQLGVNTVPEFPLDIKTTNASATAIVSSFHNLDYTVGTKTFIRVRTQTSAGSSFSSYLGTGQDGTLHIVANDFARGGDIKINPTTGAVTVNSTISASNFSGTSSGTNTGDQTLASLGGLPLTGGILTGDLQMGNNQNRTIKFRSVTSWDYSLKGINDDFFISDNPGLNYLSLYYNGGGNNRYISLMGGFNVYATGAATFSSSITATNIILNSINSVTSTAGQNIINSTYTGINGNWITYQNAGGILYAGLEDSTSSSFGATAYAGVLYLTGARNLEIFTSSAKRLTITSTGIVQPGANGTQDLGTASLRWGTVYTSDLSLSNGVGDYTIVEGENDLFLYNNKQNKVYKFLLAEVNPSEATPKKS